MGRDQRGSPAKLAAIVATYCGVGVRFCACVLRLRGQPLGPMTDEATTNPRLMVDDGWTAKVVKNDSDDGWAVEMYKDGQSEPALVGPWTMGRDKKNPKPLDPNAFHTLVKTATEVLARHEQQRKAMLHRSFEVTDDDGGRIEVNLDIVPDEDDPHAYLSAVVSGETVAKVRVMPNYKLSQKTAEKWVSSRYSNAN